MSEQRACPGDTHLGSAPSGLVYIHDTVSKAYRGRCDLRAEPGDVRIGRGVWCLKARKPKGDDIPFAAVFVDGDSGGYFSLYKTGWNNDAQQVRHYFRDRDDAANFLLFAISNSRVH